jgi:hypothetical protein
MLSKFDNKFTWNNRFKSYSTNAVIELKPSRTWYATYCRSLVTNTSLHTVNVDRLASGLQTEKLNLLHSRVEMDEVGELVNTICFYFACKLCHDPISAMRPTSTRRVKATSLLYGNYANSNTLQQRSCQWLPMWQPSAAQVFISFQKLHPPHNLALHFGYLEFESRLEGWLYCLIYFIIFLSTSENVLE